MSLFLTSMPVLAADNTNSLEVIITSEDGQKSSKYFDLSDLTTTVKDKNGVMPLINLSASELKNGYTKTYWDSDGSRFYIAGGSTVTFIVKLESSAHVVMGYKDPSDNMIQTYNGTGRTNTTSISIEDTGYYTFYITNVSSSTIRITGGSITF